MTTTSFRDPDEQRHTVPPQYGRPGQGGDLPDIREAVRDFNESNPAHQSLWDRTRQAADAVGHAIDGEAQAWQAAHQAHEAHLAVLAEHPHRRADRAKQSVIATGAIALDGVACWFAAEALGNGQTETLLWTVLFLAVLGAGEVALDYCSDRSPKGWRLVLAGLGAFIAGLGVLRFGYLATVGTVGAGAALVGAVLFTTVTGVLVVIGYRALRIAETIPAWRARRRARRAARSAEGATERLAACVADRNRLADAYVSRIRRSLLDRGTLDQLPQMEAVLRLHLCGSDWS